MILMSWQNILKQRFNFDSLNFKVDRNGNWNDVYDFGEGVKFSILAGKEHTAHLENTSMTLWIIVSMKLC